MRFDWTLSIGTLLQFLAMIVAAVAVYYKFVSQIDQVKMAHASEAEDIKEIRSDLKEIKRDLIGSLERRVRDLEIGQGTFIRRPE